MVFGNLDSEMGLDTVIAKRFFAVLTDRGGEVMLVAALQSDQKYLTTNYRQGPLHL